MENGNNINELIMNELRQLRGQLDEVRTRDIPNIKVDVALLVKDSSFTSKLYSGIAVVFSFMVSVAVSHFRR